MICPLCGARTSVYVSRPWQDGRAVERKRRCPSCTYKFWTVETFARGAAAAADPVETDLVRVLMKGRDDG